MTKTRQRLQTNDFGKMVMHHLIDSEQTLAQFSIELKTLGESISESSLRILMSHPITRTVPMQWILNEDLPMFMRRYAARSHGVEIVAMYEMYTNMTGPHPINVETTRDDDDVGPQSVARVYSAGGPADIQTAAD